MPTPETLRELFSHMEWADATVWSVIHETVGAENDMFLRDTLLHLHQTQRRFLNLWTERPHGDQLPATVESLDELHRWARPFYPEARVFVDAADQSLLDGPIPEFVRLLEQHVGPGKAPITLGDTALQVVSHTTHHRAQINRRLRELGGEPQLIDYILWVWHGRPAGEWRSAR